MLAGLPPHDPAAAPLSWLGRVFIGVSFIAFGVQHCVDSGFIPDLGLVPTWAPVHWLWAWLAGAALLLAGLSILIRTGARPAMLLMGFVFLLSAFLRFGNRFPGMIHNVGDRTVFFELLSCCGASWMLASLFATGAGFPSAALSKKLAHVGLWLFAIANIVFGFGHFQGPAYIAFLIPHWIPFRLFLAWCTGCGFVAAGLAMATGIHARLGAALLGLMYFSWVVVVHAPRIAHALHNGDEWNSGYVCLTMAGCALIAAALAHRPQPQSL